MNHNYRTCFLYLLLLGAIAISKIAIAQAPISNINSLSIDQRVLQLERVINAQGDVITQLQQQLSDQQRDIEYLRGAVQKNEYELAQKIGQMKASDVQPGNTKADDNSTLIANSTDNNMNVYQLSGNEKDDYSQAVSLALEQKKYDDAITVFQEFIKKYPQSDYLVNANYWLGQLNYNKKNFDSAAYYFAYVVKHFPKSPKSPDAMLKVGLIMQIQQQLEKAKAVYQQVGQIYPATEAANEAKKRLDTLK